MSCRYDYMKISSDAQLSVFETGGKLAQFDLLFETEVFKSVKKLLKNFPWWQQLHA